MRRKKKLVKRIVSALVVVVVLAAVGVVLVALFANRAVRTAAERAGTKALNVKVEVGKAGVSFLAGALDLQNIRAANPPGYTGPWLLTLRRADVTADVGSLLGKEILIKDMKLSGGEIFVEQNVARNNLYEVIQPLREPRPPTGKRLIVDHLEIANVTVHVGLSGLPGQTPAAQFTLAPIRMTDLGRNERMDTGVLIAKIVLALAAGVAQQGGNLLPPDTVGQINSLLDKALDIGRIILGPKSGDQKNNGGAGKGLTDGLKDLLSGRKKQ